MFRIINLHQLSSISILVLYCILLGSSAYAGDKQVPNILFILTDNQAATLLGTYGNPDIKTPEY